MKEIEIEISGTIYKLIIEKKRTTKNMYLKVRENLDLYVTCNTLTTDKMVIAFVKSNEKGIIRLTERIKRNKEKEKYFYYLGKKYDIVYLNNNDIKVGENKVFIGDNVNKDKWYRKKAEDVFQEELDKMYNDFKYEIPYPSLSIRKMKTRWGVCNTKTHRVTLNLELIKKDIKYLDYVIVHELSHLLHPNHSKEFWQCVEDNFKDYKLVRKELKGDE